MSQMIRERARRGKYQQHEQHEHEHEHSQRPETERAKERGDRDTRYNVLLASSKETCQQLLETEQSVLADTLFSDNLFEVVCEALPDKNGARVIRDITSLLVPSAEHLAMCGDAELKKLIDSVNEGQNNSIPFTKTRPQPDFAVGSRREAFSEDQVKKHGPFVGGYHILPPPYP